MTLEALMQLARDGGAVLAPIFALLWWLERDERKDAQSELKLLTKDTVTTMTKLEAGVGQIVTIFRPNGGP